jgi:hypothetical protein
MLLCSTWNEQQLMQGHQYIKSTSNRSTAAHICSVDAATALALPQQHTMIESPQKLTSSLKVASKHAAGFLARQLRLKSHLQHPPSASHLLRVWHAISINTIAAFA